MEAEMQVKGRILIALTALVIGSAGAAHAQVINGLNTQWSLVNGTSVPGFAVVDANTVTPNQGDAYDNGLVTTINGTVVGSGAAISISSIANGQLGTVPAQGIGTLSVNKSFLAHNNSPTLRTLLEITNTANTTQTATVVLETNNGSDSGTQIITSFTGDTTFTTADRWVVTDDANTTGGDPTNLHSIWGQNAAITPSTVGQTTSFVAAGTEGIVATFSIPIPAAQTLSLMFLNQIWPTATEATASAPSFNGLGTLPTGLLSDLSQTQINQIVNWGPVTVSSAAPEPGTFALMGLTLLSAAGLRARRRR